MRAMTMAATAAILASCGGDRHDYDHADVMAGMDDMRAEVDRHHGYARTAPSIPDVIVDAERHHATMLDLMDGVRASMSSHAMTSCPCHGAGTMEMSGMMGTMDAMGEEMHDHLARVRAAPDMDGARAACDEHAAAMETMFREMDAAMDSCRLMTW